MKSRKLIIQKILTWILLAAVSINSLGSAVPAGSSVAYATSYEKASEEAEEEIRAAESAAKEKQMDGIQENEELENGAAKEETFDEGLSEESIDIKKDLEEESVLYESKTISSPLTLTENLEVGDLTINSEIHLNGHKLVVHGDTNLNSDLYIEEGYLIVEKNFSMGTYARIYMQSRNDFIEIAGDYIYPDYYYPYHINKGTFKISGNIYGSKGNYCRSSVVFGDDCKVVLCGDDRQTIDIHTNSKFKINHLVIENTSDEGVFSDYMLVCNTIVDKENKLHYKAEGKMGEVLEEDKEIEGDYKRQYVYEENGREVTGYSAGRLVMQNESDYMMVKGNYIDSGITNTEEDLTAGILELQGSMLADDTLTHSLFQGTGSHTVRLTGNGVQKIQNGAEYSGDRIRFGNFVVAQPETGSVVLEAPAAVTSSLLHESGHITGTTIIEGAEIKSTDLYGDIQIQQDYQFQSDVTIHGSLYMGYNWVYDKKITVNNCHITVEGNYYHTNVNFVFTGDHAVFTTMGDFILNERCGNVVNSGVIEIAGDLKKNDTNAYLSFREGAEIRFIGTKEQRVSISHQKALLTNVVVDNPAGVVAEDDIAVINVSCKQGVLSYASGAVHGFTVEEDGIYEGDLEIGGGVFDLNGHSYHIKGDLTIKNGVLNMTHEGDSLVVDGNFKTTTSMSQKGKLTAGTMEVKGNFTQEGNGQSFVADGKHTMLFSGLQSQKITFLNPYTSYFQNVMFQNAEGVVLSKEAKVNGKVEQKGPVEGYLCIGRETSFGESGFCGDVRVAEEITLSKNMKIDGNFNIQQPFFLNGKTLEVTKKVTANYYGTVRFQHGHLICKDFWTDNSSAIFMENADDHLTVTGKFESGVWFKCFAKGVITVGGDVCFGKGWGDPISEEGIFELNGKEKQTITMYENVQCLGTLVLNNTSEEGVYVTNLLNCTKLSNIAGTKVTFADGGILGYTLQQDEVVEGDLLLSGGEMDLNGCHLTVKGDLVQSGGNLSINDGNLTVEGDYCLAQRTEEENGTYSYEQGTARLCMKGAADTVTIKGNLYMAGGPGYMDCTEGTMNLEGNLTVTESGYFQLGSRVNFVLTGKKQQEFMFRDARLYVGNFSIHNTKGVKFAMEASCYLDGTLCTNGYPVEGWIAVCENADIKDNYIRGNINFYQSYSLDQDLYIDGKVTLGSVDLNGHHLTVGSDCIMYTERYEGNYQDDGILEVKGNLLYNYNDKLNRYIGSNQLILSGDEKQIIIANNRNWKFHEIVIANTSDEGVYSKELLDADIITDPEHKLSFGIEGDVGYTLTKDTVIRKDLILLAGKMDLNGHKLTVMGDVMQRGGSLNINGGKLEVYGDYTMGNPDASGNYQRTTACLVMNEENDYACFHQNVILAPGFQTGLNLTKGTMEIKGDFTYQDNYYTYIMNPEFQVIFSGNEKQTVKNLSKYCFRFQLGTIDFENTSADGVVMADDFVITNPVKGNGNVQGTEGKILYWNNGEDILIWSSIFVTLPLNKFHCFVYLFSNGVIYPFDE